MSSLSSKRTFVSAHVLNRQRWYGSLEILSCVIGRPTVPVKSSSSLTSEFLRMRIDLLLCFSSFLLGAWDGLQRVDGAPYTMLVCEEANSCTDMCSSRTTWNNPQVRRRLLQAILLDLQDLQIQKSDFVLLSALTHATHPHQFITHHTSYSGTWETGKCFWIIKPLQISENRIIF